MNVKVIDRIIEESRKVSSNIVLFGAGRMAEEFIYGTKLEIPRIIFDNDRSKWGTKIADGYLVVNAEKLKEIADKKSVLVLILSGHDVEIAKQLKSYGFYVWISLRYIMHRIMVEEYLENISINSCMIETSSFCNARCTFCNNPTMHREKSNMTNEIFEQVIYRLQELNQYPEIFWLHCLGEPLIDPGLFQKIKRLKQDFPKSRIGYASNFAIASEESIRDILDSGQDFLVISLNSCEAEEYQRIMGLDYSRTIHNVLELLKEKEKRNSNLEVILSIVENADNCIQIQKFREIWKQKDVKIRCIKEGKWLGEEKHQEADKKEIKKEEYIGHTLKHHVCQMLYREICILSDGSYALCCFDGEGIMKLGNVKNMSIYDMYHKEERKRLIMEIMDGESDLDICKGCSFWE